MIEKIKDRLWSLDRAFDDPFTLWTIVALGVFLVAAGAIIWGLKRSGTLGSELCAELRSRYVSWLWLTAILLVPLIVGAAWVMLAVCLLSLLCYQEYARATGLFREKTISIFVVLGILTVAFANFDNYTRLFFAAGMCTTGFITIATIPQDRPKGYIQRTALGVLGFALLGYSFGYLGLMANTPHFRPILLLIVIATELNDVFAYCVGKTLGGPKLIPNTSPGKTIAGSVGALVLTTLLVAGLGHVVFRGTAVDEFHWLLMLGLGLSVLGQFGDLLLSSLKRDLGLKDMGAILPGHGGLLDRFDSLVLVPPAAYHFLSLLMGPLNTLDGQAERIVTGGN
jgi:phosphatidate cytidylyltransferase